MDFTLTGQFPRKRKVLSNMKNFQEISNLNESTTAQVNDNTAKVSRRNESKQKRQAVPPMWRILGKAQKKFNSQLTKDNSVKLRCIEAYLASDFDDAPKFWGDFMRQVDQLLDSRRFIKECSSLGCMPECIAEHIVFLGKATMSKVLKYGVLNTIGNHFKLYVARLSPSDADIYRNEAVSHSIESEKSSPQVEEAA